MRRKGLQHGMVRTYPILPPPYNPSPSGRILNRIDLPPTAGLFTKVPMRPTNHSKFTGKCGRPRCSVCHLRPIYKSKNKTKGNNKIKSLNASVHQMVMWRVVDDHRGLSLSSVSASGLQDHLADYGYDDDIDEGFICRELVPAADNDERKGPNPACHNCCDHDGCSMDFYDVGFMLDHIEEGGWCLVGDW